MVSKELYEDHDQVINLLTRSQDDEIDMREDVRNADLFINKKDGQWEPDIISKWRNKPRYTIDHTSVAVNRIAGEINKTDFDVTVRPSGGEASFETAKLYDGIIRNIKAISGFSYIRRAAVKGVVGYGIAGWEIVQDWADEDSFEQDLLIRPMSEFENRVWFDPNSELQDKSDSNFLFDLRAMTPSDYKAKFPKGKEQSLSTGKEIDAYQYKPEMVWVGRFLYKVEERKELVMMSNGAVYERTEDFDSVVEELAEQGITIALDDNGNERVRVRKSWCFYSRLFDAGGWLTAPQKTVFSLPPIIPVYGNYKISEGKVTYHGEIRRMMDPARLYNYTISKKFEEVALSPKSGKILMTREQAEGEEASLRTMNTNSDPVQFYNHVEGQSPPFQFGGAQINAGLTEASNGILTDLQTISGQSGVSAGNFSGQMSEATVLSLQERVDVSNSGYADALEIALCATARVLIDAIPKVYDSARQVRILKEDGEIEMVTLFEQVYDKQSGRMKTLNDLSKGKYDVVCTVGKDYKSRQQQTVEILKDLSAAIPGVGELSADVIMKNIGAPGTDIVADRIRARMIQAGLIPQDQMDEEELMALQQAMMQPEEPDPATVLAQAEVGRVQAETANIVSLAEERQSKLFLEQQKLMLKAETDRTKQELDQIKMVMEQQNQQTQNQMQMLQILAEAMKDIKDAMGAQAIVNENAIEAYDYTAEAASESSENLQSSLDRR